MSEALRGAIEFDETDDADVSAELAFLAVRVQAACKPPGCTDRPPWLTSSLPELDKDTFVTRFGGSPTKATHRRWCASVSAWYWALGSGRPALPVPTLRMIFALFLYTFVLRMAQSGASTAPCSTR